MARLTLDEKAGIGAFLVLLPVILVAVAVRLGLLVLAGWAIYRLVIHFT